RADTDRHRTSRRFPMALSLAGWAHSATAAAAEAAAGEEGPAANPAIFRSRPCRTSALWRIPFRRQRGRRWSGRRGLSLAGQDLARTKKEARRRAGESNAP